MKTGVEVLERALSLLGYTNHFGEVDGVQYAEMMKRSSAVIVQVYVDLRSIESPNDIPEYTDIAKDLPLSYRAVNDIMPYGVAMKIAEQNADGDSVIRYSQMYNDKRKACKKPQRRIANTLPRGGY